MVSVTTFGRFADSEKKTTYATIRNDISFMAVGRLFACIREIGKYLSHCQLTA